MISSYKQHRVYWHWSSLRKTDTMFVDSSKRSKCVLTFRCPRMSLPWNFSSPCAIWAFLDILLFDGGSKYKMGPFPLSDADLDVLLSALFVGHVESYICCLKLGRKVGRRCNRVMLLRAWSVRARDVVHIQHWSALRSARFISLKHTALWLSLNSLLQTCM